MYTRRFFIAALFFILVVVLLGLGFGFLVGAKPSMQMTGALLVPYGCFFLLVGIWSFNKSPRVIRRVAYRLPMFFLLLQLAYFALRYWLGVSYAPNLVGLGSIFIVVATYVTIIGYLYVFVVEQYYISYLFQKRAQHKMKFAASKPTATDLKPSLKMDESSNKLRC